MTKKLYHYVHCPFCVRVRMALGFLSIDYTSNVLPYDDEATPIKLTGKKILPAFDFGSDVINESLDIMERLDKGNRLSIKRIINEPSFKEFEMLLSRLSDPVHSLALPYWIWTPEFNQTSREYFQKKKEVKRGPFKNLVHNREQFIQSLEIELVAMTDKLQPFFESANFGLKDILLASHLWGLYVVPEFQFPQHIHDYLQNVKELCSFDYHKDFWV